VSGGISPLALSRPAHGDRVGSRRRLSAYQWFLAAGCFAGVIAGSLTPSAQEIGRANFALAASLLIVPALLGARIWFVLLHWASFRQEPSVIWLRSGGGSALYGGLLVAVPISIPLLALAGLRFGAFWDAASVTMLVGLLFTRIGCSLNGCCRGVETTRWFGIRLPDERGNWRRRVPTQLLEAAWAALALVVAVVIEGRLPFAGFLFLAVLAGYGALRLALDRTRAERVGRRANLVASALLVSAGVALCFVWWIT
jgi:phosphatidylglycerol:prolipoprotein diacylglycerol transferase